MGFFHRQGDARNTGTEDVPKRLRLVGTFFIALDVIEQDCRRWLLFSDEVADGAHLFFAAHRFLDANKIAQRFDAFEPLPQILNRVLACALGGFFFSFSHRHSSASSLATSCCSYS